MTDDWRTDIDAVYKATIRLLEPLESLRSFRYRHKQVTEFRFQECSEPQWESTSEDSGVVTIDPAKHQRFCIAHLMGHGFHECLRRDLPKIWHDDKNESETVAETIRYFVESRLLGRDGVPRLPRAEYADVLDACGYDVGQFNRMLFFEWTPDRLREQRAKDAASRLDPTNRLMEEKVTRQTEAEEIRRVREQLGCHIVLVFRKGGRIKEEKRYDSESDCCEDVREVGLTMHVLRKSNETIGTNLIGRGSWGLLPWDDHTRINALTPEEQFDAHGNVRVADVFENTQSGVTTIYLEAT